MPCGVEESDGVHPRPETVFGATRTDDALYPEAVFRDVSRAEGDDVVDAESFAHSAHGRSVSRA